jgi:hypothetical protein
MLQPIGQLLERKVRGMPATITQSRKRQQLLLHAITNVTPSILVGATSQVIAV